jgi:deazaflavin-dependent oxidoreductase (nitroreductase family)
VLLTIRGRRSGKLHKVPLMRVEHEGRYAAVASKGGAPDHPVWYANLVANPHIELQDGTVTREYDAREVSGEEREQWWERAVAPTRTTRTTRRGPTGRSPCWCWRRATT